MSNIGPTTTGIIKKIEELGLWGEVIKLVREKCLEEEVTLPDGVPCANENCLHMWATPCAGCGRILSISNQMGNG